MPPQNNRTVLIKTSSFSSHVDVVSALSRQYGDDVVAVQVCPGGSARVTFSTSVFKSNLEMAGSMELGDVQVPVFQPAVNLNLLVYGFPFEGSDQELAQYFGSLGVVKSVRKQTWTNAPDVYTGTRIVKITVKPSVVIRRNVTIDGIKCKVWYRGQPTECDICLGGHKAANCPLKGKCLRCRQEGHISRSCPNPAWVAPADDPAVGSADPAPVETAVQSSSSPSPPSSHPPPPPPSPPSVEAMEHEDASQSILASVTPADSLVGVPTGANSVEGESEDLRDNELSGVTPLEGVSFPTVHINSVSQAATGNVTDNDSQATVNEINTCSDSQAAASQLHKVSRDGQAASPELISSCGSQAAATNITSSNDSQAAANKIINSGCQAAAKKLTYNGDSQAAVADLPSSSGSQAADDSPSPSPVHSQVLLLSPEMEVEVCSGQRKRAHSSSDDVEDGFRKPRTPTTTGVKKQASSAPSRPRSASPAGRGRSRSPRVSGAVHQHLPVSVSALPPSARRP